MSIEIMTQVWRDSKAFGSDLLILLAIADHADDHGRAFPSVRALQQKGRMSERNVQYCLKRLAELGELKIEHGAGPHGTHVFWVLPGGAEPAPVQTLHRRRRTRKNKKIETIDQPETPQEPGANIAPGAEPAPVQNMRGAMDCTRGVQPVAPEPSVEPSGKEKELPPEKTSSSLSPQGSMTAAEWRRKWPASKRFPNDFPENPPDWFVAWAAEHVPHVDIPHHWEYMRDYTFQSPRTQFFMCARKWMETEEEKYQRWHNSPRASPHQRSPDAERQRKAKIMRDAGCTPEEIAAQLGELP